MPLRKVVLVPITNGFTKNTNMIANWKNDVPDWSQRPKRPSPISNVCKVTNKVILKKKNRNFFSIIQRFFFLFSERKSTNGIVRSCPSNIPNLVQAFTKISQSYQTTTQTFCGLYFATFVHLSVLWSFTQGLSWEIFSHNSCSSGKHNSNVQKSNSIIGEMNQLQRNHRITAW